MEYTKISPTQIEVTKEIITPVKVETQTYERKFIEDQIKAITESRDEQIALKEAELKECTDILAEMDLKGIIIKEEIAVEKEPMPNEEIMVK
jgi:hypothetical protein